MSTKKRTAPHKSNVLDLSDVIPNKSGKPAFTERNQGRVLDFYILGDIEEPHEYAEWFDTIRNCGQNDVVRLHFNSSGGDLFTAIQFMRVLRECSGLTIASAEGACMSAATLIFLACDTFEVSAHTSFMIHNYSGGAFGKGGEMICQIDFERSWAHELLHDGYADFLTKNEITDVLNGKDLWLSSKQVVERLNKRQTIRQDREKKDKGKKSKKVEKTDNLQPSSS